MAQLALENIRFVPSIHQRMAFADAARRAFFEHEPDCVALELPAALKEWIVRGVMRLPQVSAVCHPTADDGEMLYVPIDPCDSMIEAARLAIEAGIEILWLEDEPARNSPPVYPLPDDLTAERAGLEEYVNAVAPYLPKPSGESSARERLMAERLAEAAAEGKRVLCVLGLAHYLEVRRLLEARLADSKREAARPAVRPAQGAFLAHVKPESLPELFAEVPYAAYRRELAREEEGEGKPAAFDKMAVLSWIYKRAKRSYRDEFKSEVSLAQMKALHQFTRNLAFVHGRLQPDTYELVLGARGAVDGDYGYSVYELARSYPLQTEEAEIPTLNLRDGRGTFSDREQKFRMSSQFGDSPSEKIKLRFRRRPTLQMREEWKEQWQKGGWLYGPCSWPPEDERQERFMMHVRKRALEAISEDRKQVSEFTTSIMDGLDLRETMRNWHTKKLYVHQTPQPQGKVGAVVVVFEDQAADENYSWRATLYAENQNESDISFYATPLGDRVVGPRISLTEFGGLLSIYPSLGIPDIWSMPDAAELPRCSDVLLAAAILFSPDRFVAYVSEKPPSGVMRELAAQFRKHVIHLPIRRFPSNQLRRVRRFHILDGKSARSYAADYIFDE